MSIIDKIASEQNLLWAWEKVHGYYRTMENYYDMLVVAEFETHLNDILADMVEKLKKGRYRLETIKPIPRPQKSKDEAPAIRSFFNVSICDQILWIAIINIIGPDIECEMPFWSFGNRLNIPLYRDEDTWRHGWYRYGSYNMYTPWFQACSRYQKSTKITLKRMFYQQKEEGAFLSEELESYEVELLNESKANLGHLQINYLDRDYWSQPLGGEVYWTSLDFEKFYPSINLDKLRDILLNRYPGDVDFHNLIKKALDFQVDRSDFSDE